jgi:Ras GTPase-activating-like protein IQGAP2/3
MNPRRSGLTSVRAPNMASLSRTAQLVASQTQARNPDGIMSANRYSVSAFYSMAAEHDPEVNDDLAIGKIFNIIQLILVFN